MRAEAFLYGDRGRVEGSRRDTGPGRCVFKVNSFKVRGKDQKATFPPNERDSARLTANSMHYF